MITLTRNSPQNRQSGCNADRAMLLQHGLSDMLFLRAVYFLSRDIEKNGEDLIGGAQITSNTYPHLGQPDDIIAYQACRFQIVGKWVKAPYVIRRRAHHICLMQTIHRDVRVQSILISSERGKKLSNFSLATQFTKKYPFAKLESATCPGWHPKCYLTGKPSATPQAGVAKKASF